MDSTNIIPVTIEDEMRGSYLDYAMSVIIGRALPDVRDGLKPVHRRILFAMLGEGLVSNRKYSKCAGVVGEVLKRLHPHGDSAVYDALVRMAQGWSMRYPLIDGQGNFGSIDGDPAAAYRYTECRMESIAEAMLSDIDKETVDFIANFDESSEEPVVLPSRVPSLLINGSEGIAVGMASKIPPHNLKEVIEAAILKIQNPEVTLEELMEVIPGPDFPTSGIIYGAAGIKQAYRHGRGTIKVRAKVSVETAKNGRESIIVDELPYQVNKARLIEKMAELVHDKRITDVSKLRDESDRRGMRIVIELKKDSSPEVVINQLYKMTLMERSFGVNMLAIVENVPKVLSLSEVLEEFNDHRRTVVIRRTRYELGKAKERLHILEGYRIALENIDEVIALIKASESTAVARTQLMERFSLSEVQAQTILDMPLRRLTGLERQAIEEEYRQLLERIEELTQILSDSAQVDRIVVEELREISEKFGDERRTEIEEYGEEIEDEDLIVEEPMMVTISHRGYAKRCSPSVYRAQRRGGKGVRGTKKLSDGDEDFVSELFTASTHAYLLVFTTQGRLYWLKVYRLPETSRTARGRAIVNILNLKEEEKVSAIMPVRHFEEGKYVVMVTRKGYIKRVDLMAFSRVRNSGLIASTLDDGDELVGARITDGKRDMLILSDKGMAIRFSENDVRPMGRNARGVRAMQLGEDDKVISVVTVISEDIVDAHPEAERRGLLTVCENGYGKRTLLSEYRRQGRGGKGLIDIKTGERNGAVVGAVIVDEDYDVMLISTAGKVIRMNASDISLIGRNTMGVRLVNLDENELVAAVARCEREEDEEDGDEGGEEQPQGSLNGDGPQAVSEVDPASEEH